MKVKEAIAQLKKMNPEAIIITASGNPELQGALVECKYLQEGDGYRGERQCRDMMDGTTYSIPVINMLKPEAPTKPIEPINFVRIS
jgi:hypothetical protein